MRSIDKDLEEAGAPPVRVVLCPRIMPDTMLSLVSGGRIEKPLPLGFLLPSYKLPEGLGVCLLDNEEMVHSKPIELAMTLFFKEAGMRLPQERFLLDGRWIRSAKGDTYWEYLYFVDVYEAERNELLFDSPLRKTKFHQLTVEQLRGLAQAERLHHFLRLNSSLIFAETLQRAA